MSNQLETTYRPLLEAVAFAARAHRDQWRKDKETPYCSHPFRVCLIAREVFGITDPRVLAAAVLHDTIEDTTTDFDDLEEKFGADIAAWVAALSKDKRQRDAKREPAYMRQFTAAPWPVHVCKLGDIFDNLMDSVHTKPEQQAKTLKRSQTYLAALKPKLSARTRKPFAIVSRLLAEIGTKQG
ncbi:MAG: HD domain-containing protein [Verrucomicrobia bacterium]|nr:HD domain-containing protein [Verrucomicrobiota bacterium]